MRCFKRLTRKVASNVSRNMHMLRLSQTIGIAVVSFEEIIMEKGCAYRRFTTARVAYVIIRRQSLRSFMSILTAKHILEKPKLKQKNSEYIIFPWVGFAIHKHLCRQGVIYDCRQHLPFGLHYQNLLGKLLKNNRR